MKDIKYVEAQEVIHLRGKVIPLIRMDQVLDIEPKEEEPESLTVVIVQQGENLAGLVVDNLIGQNRYQVLVYYTKQQQDHQRRNDPWRW